VNRLAEILEEKGGEVFEIDAESSVFAAVCRSARLPSGRS
jgi:hypothetical protein